MEVANVNVNVWLKNEKDCLDLVNKQWDKIPLLNSNEVQNLQNSKLVRFRGMVQDMYNPEYYLEKYEVVDEVSTETSLKDGKYLDGADCTDKEVVNFESSKNVTSQRHTFFLISMPGLNKWAEDLETSKHKIAEKKDASTSTTRTKRPLDEEDAESEPESQIPTTSKKQCSTTLEEPAKLAVSPEHLNFPLPDRSGKACLLKMYTDPDEIKLNDLIECVGFLSVNPLLGQGAYAADEDAGDTEMELQTYNPPPSLIPRIHCVTFKKIENYNPFYEEAVSMPAESMQFLRKELHIVLTQLLLGDELAAEYLIYHLISKVYLRQDILVLGKFSMNISNIPTAIITDYGERVYKFIEQLVPKSHYLPMTLKNMNDLAYIPKKDYQYNRIISGILQLSSNTHLVLDETKLTAGKLGAAGVQAVSAISNVIRNQKTIYDFSYYNMEFDCDIPILVLSQAKSLLPSDCHVPLQIDEVCLNTFKEITEALELYLKPDLLNPIRTYLSHRRHGEYELSDDINEFVQNEFVDMRRTCNATAEDLHSLLVLARLVCLAEGKTKLDEPCWRRARQLEIERKERLPKS